MRSYNFCMYWSSAFGARYMEHNMNCTLWTVTLKNKHLCLSIWSSTLTSTLFFEMTATPPPQEHLSFLNNWWFGETISSSRIPSCNQVSQITHTWGSYASKVSCSFSILLTTLRTFSESSRNCRYCDCYSVCRVRVSEFSFFFRISFRILCASSKKYRAPSMRILSWTSLTFLPLALSSCVLLHRSRHLRNVSAQ